MNGKPGSQGTPDRPAGAKGSTAPRPAQVVPDDPLARLLTAAAAPGRAVAGEEAAVAAFTATSFPAEPAHCADLP